MFRREGTIEILNSARKERINLQTGCFNNSTQLPSHSLMGNRNPLYEKHVTTTFILRQKFRFCTWIKSISLPSHVALLWRKTFSMENLIILSNYVKFILFNIWNGFFLVDGRRELQTFYLLSFLLMNGCLALNEHYRANKIWYFSKTNLKLSLR